MEDLAQKIKISKNLGDHFASIKNRLTSRSGTSGNDGRILFVGCGYKDLEECFPYGEES